MYIKKTLCAIILVIFFIHCGTFASITQKEEGSFYVYSGVAKDLHFMKDRNLFPLGLVLIFDLPFSFFLDTILLPVSITKTVVDTSSKPEPAKQNPKEIEETDKGLEDYRTEQDLEDAVKKKDIDKTKILISKIISLKGENALNSFFTGNCQNLLIQAIQNKDIKMIELLLEYKSDPDILPCNRKSNSPLFYAVQSNELRIVQSIFSKTKKINIQSNFGNTPVIVLLSNPETKPELVDYLLSLKPDLKIKNSEGKTALDVAEKTFGVKHSIYKKIKAY